MKGADEYHNNPMKGMGTHAAESSSVSLFPHRDFVCPLQNWTGCVVCVKGATPSFAVRFGGV